MTLPLHVRAHQTIWDDIYEFDFVDTVFFCIASEQALPSLNIAADTDTWILTQPPAQTVTAVLGAPSLTVRRYVSGPTFLSSATALLGQYGSAPHNSNGTTPGHYVSPPIVPTADWNSGSSQTARQFVRSAVAGINGQSYDLAITAANVSGDMRVVWTVNDVNGPPAGLAFGADLFTPSFAAVDSSATGYPGSWSDPFEYIK